MLTHRQLFLNNVAQTSPFPLGLEIERAEGIYLWDRNQKKYIDLIAGISVSNVGHRHPMVIKAIEKQLASYMHLMVYGEYVQTPQVELARKITELLPSSLDNVFFVNSGSEAIEGAMKLAKRYTGRHEIVAFENAYHGSTQGALSLSSDEDRKTPFLPLLPEIQWLKLNNQEDLSKITQKTACVIIEPIQGEAGVRETDKSFMLELRKKCTETETLLVFDEIQTGFGRTGKMFAFEHYDVVPDIITFAKGMGGGMPIGAFVSSKEIMQTLTFEPVLGHITTFGGHPVCCASAIGCISALFDDDMISSVEHTSNIFRKNLSQLSIVKDYRSKGLLIAVEFDSFETNKRIIDRCIENGVITDWFLYSPQSMRIAPPLNITEDECELACELIIKSL
ncbi:MAG: aspartate aminotransferase family protein [Bacteroidota bacterium]